jgi:hypothetical protein
MSNIKPLFCVQNNISRFMEGVVCKNTSWKSIICAHNEQHQTFCFVSKKKKNKVHARRIVSNTLWNQRVKSSCEQGSKHN